MKYFFLPSILFAVSLLFISACNGSAVEEQQIITSGSVKGLPSGMIYMVEAYDPSIIIDSVSIEKESFTFRRTIDSVFVPFLVGLKFKPNTDSTYKGLFFINEFVRKAEQTGPFPTFSAFYLEKGRTQIFTDDSHAISKLGIRVKIKSGGQTKAYYTLGGNDFAWLGNTDSLKRNAIVKKFIGLVKDNSNSYFLLQSLYNNRFQYSADETHKILLSFSEELNSSKTAQGIISDLKSRRAPGTAFTNFAFPDASMNYQNIIGKGYKLNMIVFWASWCGPCRAEIPLLKHLNDRYKQKGLRLISVSIDKDELSWKNALLKESMDWSQVIVEQKDSEKVKQAFGISSIPLVCFLNDKGIEVDHFIGSGDGIGDLYEKVIKSYLE